MRRIISNWLYLSIRKLSRNNFLCEKPFNLNFPKIPLFWPCNMYSGFIYIYYISALTVILDSPAMVFQPSVDRQRSRDSAAGGGVGSAGGSDGGFWSNAPSSAGARTGIYPYYPYGIHGICDDVVHLQHGQSYMGCMQLPVSYWMNLWKTEMNYVIISTKSASDLSSYTE